MFHKFENIAVMAERRKTAEAEKRADKAETRANEEKIRADKAENLVLLTEIEGIKSLVKLCREVRLSKEAAIRKLMDKKGLSREESASKVESYWKDL